MAFHLINLNLIWIWSDHLPNRFISPSLVFIWKLITLLHGEITQQEVDLTLSSKTHDSSSVRVNWCLFIHSVLSYWICHTHVLTTNSSRFREVGSQVKGFPPRCRFMQTPNQKPSFSDTAGCQIFVNTLCNVLFVVQLQDIREFAS